MAESPTVSDVITAFLWDGERILLSLRSGDVSTFPHHWAAISGYVEEADASPLERAFIEIDEETGIPRDAVTLLAAGDVIEVRTEQHDRVFRVHPFLFRLEAPGKVQGDWESQRFEWVPPEDLLAGRREPTVPQLREALENVWPAWPVAQAIGANLEAACNWLRTDRSLGAGSLARAAAAELRKIVRLGEELPLADCRRHAVEAAAAFGSVRPAMAAPRNLLEDIAADLQSAEDTSQMLAAIDARMNACDTAEAQVAENAARAIGSWGRVMTISYSGTVLRSLLQAKETLQRVYICEGRPLCEGRRLAGHLVKAGIAVSLLTDAQAFAVMPEVDGVLLGADSILQSGAAVNKVGSALLAMSARHYEKPVVVAAATLKCFREGGPEKTPEESNPPEEVWENPPEGVRVRNDYFEAVPAEWITAVVTEAGQRPAR